MADKNQDQDYTLKLILSRLDDVNIAFKEFRQSFKELREQNAENEKRLYIVDRMESEIQSLTKNQTKLFVRLQDLENDQKYRDELRKTITNPLLQKAMWAIIFGVACVILGAFWHEVKNKATADFNITSHEIRNNIS